LLKRSIDRLKLLKSRLSPNHKPSKVTTRCKLQQVKPLNMTKLNTRKVPKRLHYLRPFGSVHNKRTFPTNVTTVPHLTNTRPNPNTILRLLSVIVSTDLLQDLDSS